MLGDISFNIVGGGVGGGSVGVLGAVAWCGGVVGGCAVMVLCCVIYHLT